ncbi:hypothetical protein AAZX31_08G190700 [Glycine max]
MSMINDEHDNISLLSSLQYFILYYCTITRFPESIKYLPRLELLQVSGCKMLQCIPELPKSIQHLHVCRGQSLQTVLISMIGP